MLRNLNLTCLAVAAGSLLTLGLAPDAQAGVVVNVHSNVYQNHDASGIPTAVNRRTSSAGAGINSINDAVQLNSSGPSAATTAGASAHASEGRIGVRAAGGATFMTGHYTAQGEAYMPSQGAWGQAEASAGWTDMVTISDPALNGQRGRALARLDITGAVSAQAAHFINVRNPDGSFMYLETKGDSRVSVAGNGLNWTTQNWDDGCASVGWAGHLACAGAAGQAPNGLRSYSENNAGSLVVELDFWFGQAFSLGYTLTAYAGGSGGWAYWKMAGGGEGSAAADFSHTLLWDGITDVFDARGARVTGFAVSSASGFDYLQAAPTTAVTEPASAALSLLAIALAGASCRRRARSATHYNAA